ncbi:MAG: GIY-YIG nuclease family protein, partial [Minisyncoccia bacterium]
MKYSNLIKIIFKYKFTNIVVNWMDECHIIIDAQGFSDHGVDPIPKELLEEKYIKDKVNKKNGVYLLFNDDELVYIGHSKNLYDRIRNGHNRSTRLNDKWNKFAYIITHDNKQAKDIESILIHICKPKYNKG